MDAISLWNLCDKFQRFSRGYDANERWVREDDALQEIAIERARIRRELLAELEAESEIFLSAEMGGEPAAAVRLSLAKSAIGRVCPEER